jgi:anti-sigma-K factor RskA
MNNERLEELAALRSLGLFDESEIRELQSANADDLLRDFDETAALLALDAPQVTPPPALKEKVLRQLPARDASSNRGSFSLWIPYAIAACLMLLGIGQAWKIEGLKSQLKAGNAEVAQLRESNALKDLRLAELPEASAAQTDPAYATSHVLVAWDPDQDRGVVTIEDLPTPPDGHAYQLWVLDPKAPSPISAGLISASRPFDAAPVTSAEPGFAVSLEPSGGVPAPTGPILFAVAPGR